MDRPTLIALASASVAAAVLSVQQLLKTIVSFQKSKKTIWEPTPHPGWQPGESQPVPFSSEETVTVDPALVGADHLYPLVISSVVPRPIAFISTRNSAGVGNLAPFSYFNVVAHNPPHVVIGFARSRERDHGRKDTLVNILETGEFVANLISEWFVEAANYCCGNFDYGKDEMKLAGLTSAPSLKVTPPRVKESAVSLECQLRHTYDTKDREGNVTGTIVIGEVVMVHVQQGVAGRSPSGKLVVDINKLQPISRLGGNTYGRSRGLFDLPRPDRST